MDELSGILLALLRRCVPVTYARAFTGLTYVNYLNGAGNIVGRVFFKSKI